MTDTASGAIQIQIMEWTLAPEHGLHGGGQGILVFEEGVEIQQIIVSDRVAEVHLLKLRRQRPGVEFDSGSDQQVNGAGLSALHNRHATDRAPEAVLAAVVVDAHPYSDVDRCELYIPTGWAARTNCCHSTSVLSDWLITHNHRHDPLGA